MVTDPPRLDGADRRFLADPYPTYARIRTEHPVLVDDDWGMPFVSRHADVVGVLRDRHRFGRDPRDHVAAEELDAAAMARTYPAAAPTWTETVRESFIDLEPPRHTRLRGLVSRALGRRSAEELRATVTARATEVVAAAVERERVEAIADVATPVPLEVISDLMGVPVEDRPQLLEWSRDIVAMFDLDPSPEAAAAAERAAIDFVAHLRPIVAARRAAPGDDLVSHMTQVSDGDERLTDDEIIQTSILTLNAGHEATVHAVGNAVLALADRPDQLDLLAAHPELAPQAVDELLRFDGPLQMFERWALVDTEVAGHPVPAGSKVGMLFGAANHDPMAFAGDPAVLDLTRDSHHHVAFGAGLHLCVGAPIARVELEAVLVALASAVARIEVDGVPERLPSFVFRGLTELPVRLHPR